MEGAYNSYLYDYISVLDGNYLKTAGITHDLFLCITKMHGIVGGHTLSHVRTHAQCAHTRAYTSHMHTHMNMHKHVHTYAHKLSNIGLSLLALNERWNFIPPIY